MIVAVGVISCLVSSWIISHFGRNPVRGGSPASESKESIKAAFSAGDLVHEVIVVVSFKVLIALIERNTVVVRMRYR